jgi:tRNA nucleotidyltransferase (CCA-adding enzyme)
MVIDIEGHYEGRENELGLLFKEPLVMVDLVDRGRNVASAVRPQKLYTFIAAARAFLENPDKKFFYPPETAALPAKELQQKLAKHGSAIIFLAFEKVDAVPDILWGQLYKSKRSLHKLIQLSGFSILRDLTWSDERTASMFIFELEQRFISLVKKHLGPPLEKKNECEKFLLKHLGSSNTVSGPYIEDGRWVVEIRRKYTDAVMLLKDKLRDGGRSTGVAEQVSKKLREGFKIFVDEEIIGVYKKNSEFAKFLTEFLSGKPKWLENA